jgi:hypothetical protein
VLCYVGWIKLSRVVGHAVIVINICIDIMSTSTVAAADFAEVS